MPRIFVQTLAVPAAAIDGLGHVNNLEFLRWMQDVATLHSAAQGWAFADYQRAGAGWVVRSHAIEYLRPAFEGDVLAMLTWVADLGATTSTRRTLFRRASDRRIVARAETRWVFVDYATGRPKRLPAAVRDAFDVVPDGEDVVASAGLDAGTDPSP